MCPKSSDILSFAQQDPVLPRGAQETDKRQQSDKHMTPGKSSPYTHGNIRSKPPTFFMMRQNYWACVRSQQQVIHWSAPFSNLSECSNQT